MKFILGKKIGMTQVFLENGLVVPVTKVQAGPCQVVQVKSEKGAVKAVQVGFDETKEKNISKPERGHLHDLNLVRNLKDFKTDSKEINRGDTITVETFTAGDKVTVVGQSKGKGFEGVVRRHHFRGGPASHGHKDNLRMPGAIGSGGIQRVFKGLRMAGRMGGERITVKNLEIIEVHPEVNELYIKGAVPGARNSLLIISGEGDLKINKVEQPVAAEQVVEPQAEVKTENITEQAQ